MEFEKVCYPLNIAFDQAAVMQWLWDYQTFWLARGVPRADRANDFLRKNLQPLQTWREWERATGVER